MSSECNIMCQISKHMLYLDWILSGGPVYIVYNVQSAGHPLGRLKQHNVTILSTYLTHIWTEWCDYRCLDSIWRRNVLVSWIIGRCQRRTWQRMNQMKRIFCMSYSRMISRIAWIVLSNPSTLMKTRFKLYLNFCFPNFCTIVYITDLMSLCLLALVALITYYYWLPLLYYDGPPLAISFVLSVVQPPNTTTSVLFHWRCCCHTRHPQLIYRLAIR